jgi:hypothetical protein
MTGAVFASVNFCTYGPWATKLTGTATSRVRAIARLLKREGVQVIQANEMCRDSLMLELSAAMGWGKHMVPPQSQPRKGDTSTLKLGGHDGVGQGFAWDPDVLQPYWVKEIDTYPGWSRNRFGVAMRAFLNGPRVGLGSLHLEFYPKGTNNKPFYDDIRYKQVDGFLEDVKSPNQSWLILGDENHAENDKPDKPGEAAYSHGLVSIGGPKSFIIRGQRTRDIKTRTPYKLDLDGHTDKSALIIPGVVVPK